MKRLLGGAIVTMFAATTLLAGCGNNGNDKGGSASPSASPSATPSASVEGTSSASAETSQLTGNLTIGSWRTEDTEAYAKIIAAFNAHYPDIKIEFKPTKNTEYNTTLNTELQSGNGPDVIHLRPYAAGAALADAGYLEPLDQIQGMDVFSPQTLLAAKGSDGKVYGVPTVFSSTQIFYNKKMFEENGLQEPKTWDDLIAIAETLKGKKITPFAFGSKEGWLLSLTHGTLAPTVYGTEFVDKILTGEAKFTSPEYVESVKVLKDLTPYFPNNYEGIGMDDMRNMFVTEQAAMIIMGDWEYAVMKKANPDLQMDVFPVPSMKGAGATVTTWVDGSFAVNAKSANKEAALKFIEFMTTQEFGTLVVNELNKPSTIKGVTANDPLVAKIASNADSISTPYAAVVYFNAGNPTTKATLENSLQGMYLNKLTPEQVAEEVQKSADTWFTPSK